MELQLHTIISDIKAKKELRHISDRFVEEQLRRYLRRNPKALKGEFSRRSAHYKKIIKEIRASLRKSFGLFRSPAAESLAERRKFFWELFSRLFALTGRPKVVLDAGSGMSPLAVPKKYLHGVTYYAYDLNEKEIEQLNRYFREHGIRGKAHIADITHAEFPPADLALLFRVTDIIDRGKGHKETEKLLRRLPAKFVAVSFATKTMGGKRMTAPRRRWMEWLCRRLGYGYRILEFEGEMVYVIQKGET